MALLRTGELPVETIAMRLPATALFIGASIRAGSAPAYPA
jgi:hypothetical protein